MKLHRQFVVLILVIALVLTSGCSKAEEDEPIFEPSVRLVLSESKVSIDDSGISKGFIDAKVMRKDNKDISTNFTITFSPVLPTIYPVDIDGNKLTELTTKPIKGEGSQDTLQFKILGSVYGGNELTAVLNVNLWFNNPNGTMVPKQSEKITVKVKR